VKKYYWSFNEDIKNGGTPENENEPCESVQACIDWAKECDTNHSDCTSVYIYRAKQIIPHVNVREIIEEAEEYVKMYDQSEYLEDWEICNFKETEMLKELDEKVNKVFKKWLKKYDRLPNLYKMVKIKEYLI